VEEILPEWVKPREAHEPPLGGLKKLLTAAQCAQLLAYNDWARYNSVYKVLNYYIKEPPFTNQLYHSERLSRLQRRLEALEAGLTPEALRNAAAQYRGLLDKKAIRLLAALEIRRPGNAGFRLKPAVGGLSVRLTNGRAAAEQPPAGGLKKSYTETFASFLQAAPSIGVIARKAGPS